MRLVAAFTLSACLLTAQDARHERADLATMIAAYTINGAYLAHREKRTGSIEAGKDADLVALSANLFTTPVESVYKVKVLLTMLEGKEVFRDSSFLTTQRTMN